MVVLPILTFPVYTCTTCCLESQIAWTHLSVPFIFTPLNTVRVFPPSAFFLEYRVCSLLELSLDFTRISLTFCLGDENFSSYYKNNPNDSHLAEILPSDMKVCFRKPLHKH